MCICVLGALVSAIKVFILPDIAKLNTMCFLIIYIVLSRQSCHQRAEHTPCSLSQ